MLSIKCKCNKCKEIYTINNINVQITIIDGVSLYSLYQTNTKMILNSDITLDKAIQGFVNLYECFDCYVMSEIKSC